MTVVELRHDFLGEHLQRVHDMLMLAIGHLHREVDDVDMGFFKSSEVLAYEVRRADKVATPAGTEQRALSLILGLCLGHLRPFRAFWAEALFELARQMRAP